MSINKEQFQAYEAVRRSGVTNMWDVKTVESLSGLERPVILQIMQDYTKLAKEFPGVTEVNNDEYFEEQSDLTKALTRSKHETVYECTCPENPDCDGTEDKSPLDHVKEGTGDEWVREAKTGKRMRIV